MDTQPIDEQTLEQLRFPIGRFEIPAVVNADLLTQWKLTIKRLPAQLQEATNGLGEAQLDTPYRPGGWTIRQLVHHLADSHMNSFTRFKLSLTEDRPVIKPYYEDRWAAMEDATRMPIAPSLQILNGVHQRWGYVMDQMTEADMAKCYHHPESKEDVRLDHAIAQYAWHSQHHLRHITALKERENW